MTDRINYHHREWAKKELKRINNYEIVLYGKALVTIEDILTLIETRMDEDDGQVYADYKKEHPLLFSELRYNSPYYATIVLTRPKIDRVLTNMSIVSKQSADTYRPFKDGVNLMRSI